MEWFFLVIVVLCYFTTCSMSYNEAFRRSDYFIPVTIAIGLLCSIIWNSMVKYIDDKNRIYYYSLVWDISTIFVYYLFPLIFLNIKLEKVGIIGIFMIVAGLIVVKLNIIE